MFLSCENPSEKRACVWSATCSWLDVEGTGHELRPSDREGTWATLLCELHDFRHLRLWFIKTTTRFPPATTAEPRLTANWQVCFLVLSTNFVPLFLVLDFSFDTMLIFSFITPLYHYFPFREIKRVLDLNSTAYGWRHGTHDSSQGPGPLVPCSKVPRWCSEGVVAPPAATRTPSPSASQPRPLQAERQHPFYILHILLNILQLWKPNATKSHLVILYHKNKGSPSLVYIVKQKWSKVNRVGHTVVEAFKLNTPQLSTFPEVSLKAINNFLSYCSQRIIKEVNVFSPKHNSF